MKLVITLEQITREYEVDEDQIISGNDWNDVLEDMLDSVKG